MNEERQIQLLDGLVKVSIVQLEYVRQLAHELAAGATKEPHRNYALGIAWATAEVIKMLEEQRPFIH